MKIKELKDLMMHFEDRKYNDYEVVFWDYARQKRMDGHFGGLSHPDKEISIPISVVGEETWINPHKVGDLPETLPSPFAEDVLADLEQKEAEMSGIKYTQYHYRCRETGNCFTTSISDTYTMCSYYCNAQKAFKKILKDHNIDVWEELKNINQEEL